VDQVLEGSDAYASLPKTARYVKRAEKVTYEGEQAAKGRRMATGASIGAGVGAAGALGGAAIVSGLAKTPFKAGPALLANAPNILANAGLGAWAGHSYTKGRLRGAKMKEKGEKKRGNIGPGVAATLTGGLAAPWLVGRIGERSGYEGK